MSIEEFAYLGALADWFEAELEKGGVEIPGAGKCLLLPRGHVEHVARQLRILGLPAEIVALRPQFEEEQDEDEEGMDDDSAADEDE